MTTATFTPANNRVMKVHMFASPKHKNGFAIQFPYSKQDVDRIRLVLGYSWDKAERAWMSEGPEVLLDMERFGVNLAFMSKEARVIAEQFRQELWGVMDARLENHEAEEYGYQKQGAKILSLMPRMILGDDMGTGKTKQSLDAADIINAQRILVLCPKTLVYNWLAEVEKWYPEWSKEAVPDAAKQRKAFWDAPQMPRVTVANYEKLIRDDFPLKLDWDLVICDEAQRLKTATTQTYKAAKKIMRYTNYAWALSGTPLEIRLPELYNIMGLLRPAVFGNYTRFRDQHLVTDWAGTVVGAKNLELLRERLGPFMLRRTKKEVLRQLPEKLPPQNAYIKFNVDEQRAYQAMTNEFNNWLTERGISGQGDPLVQLTRMQQFCCTPMLFTEELGKGSKYEALVDVLEEWDGLVVVFCFFEEVTSMLRQWLQEDPRIDYHPDAYISGAVDPRRRKVIAEDLFSNGKLGKVLVTTDAGQQGLNIVGADLIIHYDQLWNPQKMHQREDRLHRIGQQHKVHVLNMLCLDTIDVGKYQLNREREQLFEEVIDGAEMALLRKLDSPRLRRLVEGKLNNDSSHTLD